MKRITVVALIATPLLAIIGALGWEHRQQSAAIVDLRNLSAIVANCPLPPKGSDKSMIIWRTTDEKTGEEELRCMHGRIRAADVRQGPPAPTRMHRRHGGVGS